MAHGSRRARGRSVQGRTYHYPAVPARGELFADAAAEPLSKLVADPLAWAIALHDTDACPFCVSKYGTVAFAKPFSDR